jgi:hypothetical protein
VNDTECNYLSANFTSDIAGFEQEAVKLGKTATYHPWHEFCLMLD